MIAIDTDSNPNLGESLGLTLDATESMRQLPRSLIGGASGDVTVEDLLHEALADHADVTLVDMARASSTSAAPRDPAA